MELCGQLSFSRKMGRLIFSCCAEALSAKSSAFHSHRELLDAVRFQFVIFRTIPFRFAAERLYTDLCQYVHLFRQNPGLTGSFFIRGSMPEFLEAENNAGFPGQTLHEKTHQPAALLELVGPVRFLYFACGIFRTAL